MKNFFINQNFEIGLILFIILIIGFCLIVYFAFHYLIRKHLESESLLVGDFFFRFTAGILAFILSITYANQRINYQNLKTSIEIEAVKLVDIHLDLRLYNTEESRLIQVKIRDYISFTADDKWESIQNDPFFSEPVLRYRDIYEDISKLETETPLQTRLIGKMLSNMDEVMNALQTKIFATSLNSKHLIYTSFFGLIGLMLLFSVNSPSLMKIVFLSTYLAFIGVIIYFIIMMDNPFIGPLQIDSSPFILLQETIEKHFTS